MAPSRSTRCATRRGRWPSGATSTRPGTSAISTATPRLRALLEQAEGTLELRNRCAPLARSAVRWPAPSGRVPGARAAAPATPAVSTPTWWKARSSRLPQRAALAQAGRRQVRRRRHARSRVGLVGGTEGRHRGVRPSRRRRPGRAPARRAVGSGGAVPAAKSSAPASSISWTCCCTPATCCGTMARAPQLQQDYQRIFVDEFQDTDPLQAEILLLLAAADPARARLAQSRAVAGQALRGGRPEAVHLSLPPRRCAPVPPHLPRAHRQPASPVAQLTSSTRSTRTIQAFVNAAFAQTIPDYLPLEGGVEDPPQQPGVIALPMPRSVRHAQYLQRRDRGVFAATPWRPSFSGSARKAAGRCATAPPARACRCSRSTSASCSGASPISEPT